MIHLGDITKITPDMAFPVDVITFGSPCQDLSVAGKRAGLAGERSGLFMDAVRIIKNMRMYTLGVYPKFAVWENVPGAFSSNKGEDFHAVLEELARVCEAGADVPRPANGKWAKAGFIAGDHWSIAWRTLDAQFWGVPQRRKRIALVLDLRGQRAGEVLFERTGLSGNPEPSIPAWKGVARNPASSTAGYDRVVEGEVKPWAIDHVITTGGNCTAQGPCVYEDLCPTEKAAGAHAVCYAISEQPSSYTLKIRSGCEGGGKGALVQTEKSATLSTLQDQTLFCVAPICRASSSANAEYGYDLGATLTCAHDGPPIVFDARGNGDGCVCPTITGDHENRVTDYTAVVAESLNPWDTQSRRIVSEDSVSPPLSTRESAGGCQNGVLHKTPLRWIVRRLTPVECERLQGYPDGWTDIGEWVDSKGKKRKPADSPRYKAMGNSIALPQWWWITCKLAKYLPERPTLSSLFDGVGGFPLVWETRFGEGTAVWASEIEEFPIAVTKLHFPEK